MFRRVFSLLLAWLGRGSFTDASRCNANGQFSRNLSPSLLVRPLEVPGGVSLRSRQPPMTVLLSSRREQLLLSSDSLHDSRMACDGGGIKATTKLVSSLLLFSNFHVKITACVAALLVSRICMQV